MTNQPALKIHEAAELANVSTKTIRREIDRCALIAYRVGRAVRIDREDFDAWFRGTPAGRERASLVPRSPVQRPRRLPTTAAEISVAKMKAQLEQHEAA